MNKINKELVCALLTPFNQDESLDLPSLTRLIKELFLAKVSTFLIIGSTGESLNLSNSEQIALIQHTAFTLQNLNKTLIEVEKAKLWAGVFASRTREALTWIDEISSFKEIHRLLVITPYYIKPSQIELEHYFNTLADHSSIPLVLYNNPSRSGVELDIKTLQNLSQHPNIVGLKESHIEINRLNDLKASLSLDFDLYCGNDDAIGLMHQKGSKGSVSALANALPKTLVRLHNIVGDLSYQDEENKILSLLDRLVKYPNPHLAKALCSLKGTLSPELRRPLHPLDPLTLSKLYKEVMSFENSY